MPDTVATMSKWLEPIHPGPADDFLRAAQVAVGPEIRKLNQVPNGHVLQPQLAGGEADVPIAIACRVELHRRHLEGDGLHRDCLRHSDRERQSNTGDRARQGQQGHAITSCAIAR
jgi:hypothetical protein